ncbi:MAG: RAMP superfamily CRISPR-associated protein [Candidatus Poribacteria bacterium]
MSYDLYTVYPCETIDDIRRIVGNHRQAYRELRCVYTKISLLTPALTTKNRDYSRNGHYRYGGGYKSLVHQEARTGGQSRESSKENQYTQYLIQPAIKQLSALGLHPPQPDVDTLPRYSFFLQFPFTLSTPYISADDDVIYIHENPVVKDYVFKTPMVRSTSWKGNLRHAAEKLSDDSEQAAERIIRLFGTAKGEEESLKEEEGRRGRLIFYPTFFDKIDLDIINPHSRRTKAGTVPIMLEMVPKGASGYFSLMYIPFDLIGEKDENRLKTEITSDMSLVYDAICGMMRSFGFSAKRTKGYGMIKEEVVLKDKSGKRIASGVFQVAGVDEKPHSFNRLEELKGIIDRVTGIL